MRNLMPQIQQRSLGLPISLLLLLALAGCSQDTPQALMADYLQRVAYTLDEEVSLPKPSFTQLSRFPDRRDRMQPVEELRVGLLESLDFRRCGLLPLIAERNSSLGRVMQPSFTMRYELRFFDKLHQCILADRQQALLDADFSTRLEQVYRVKDHNLEAVIWNGIFTDEALEKNFSLSRPPLPLEGHPGFGSSLRALQQLTRIPSALQTFRESGQLQLPAELDNLEQAYFTLYSNEYGSQWIKSLSLTTHFLNQTAEVIENALARRPICFNGRPSEKSKILRNLFFKFYAAGVQPYIAMVNRQGQEWLYALDQLLELNTPLPAAMVLYQRQMLSDAPGSTWDQFNGAIERHTKAWQRLFTQCGTMPDRPQRPSLS